MASEKEGAGASTGAGDGVVNAGSTSAGKSATRNRGRKRRRMPKWAGRTIAVATLVIVAAVVAYFIFGRSGSTAATYRTTQAEQGTLTVTVNGSGSAVVGSSSSVVPPVSGTVEDVQAKLSDKVTKGEVLFKLHSDSLVQAVGQSRASYKQSQQQLSNAKLTLMQADRQLDQVESPATTVTRNANGTTTTTTVEPTDDDLEIAQQRVVVATKGVTAARASLASAETNYEQAQANYKARIVKATMSGTLTTFNVTSGLAFGSSGGSTSSGSSGSGSSGTGSSSSSSGSSSSGSANVVISDLSSMEAQVAINEVDLPSVKLGQQATVTFDSISGLTITGVVDAIAPQGTSSSGVVTYQVDIALDVQNSKIKPGMTCSADIVTTQVKDVVLVVNTAVKSDTQGAYVMVVELDSAGKPAGQPTRQDVTTGASNDTKTQIVSGLKSGQTVVTSTTNSNSTSTNTRGGMGAMFGGPGGR
jgi:macrolide-specific efflux system membrane fusion protein